MSKSAQKTLVTFLLDRSGSMEAIKDDTIGAFNAYLGELKKGDKIEFTFLQFDSQSIDKVCVAEPIKSVANLTKASFQPRGSTPLIDAAYKTIKAVEKALAERDDKPKVVICIQTDGQENSSTQHGWNDLQQLIKEKTAAGWQFNFMGASIDAYDQGAKMGIAAASTLSYNAQNRAQTLAAFTSSALNTARFSAGLRASTGYSVSQKQQAGDAFDPDLNGSKPMDAYRARQAAAAATSAPPASKPIVDDFTL